MTINAISCPPRCTMESSVCKPSRQQTETIDYKIHSSWKKAGIHKDAEELLIQKKPRLARQMSAHELGRGVYVDEKEELKKRSGSLWECIKRFPNPLGGNIYKFRLKKEYNYLSPPDLPTRNQRFKASETKMSEIQPAIETDAIDTLVLDPEIDAKFEHLIEKYHVGDPLEVKRKTEALRKLYTDLGNQYINTLPKLPQLRMLGYRSHVAISPNNSETVKIDCYLPDKNALLANWEALKETHPHLPNLDICGILDDEDDITFINAYITHNAPLSEKGKFFHDSHFHVIRIITQMLRSEENGNPAYRKHKLQLIKIILTAYQKIYLIENELKKPSEIIPTELIEPLKENLKIFKATLGYYTDIISSKNDYSLYCRRLFNPEFYYDTSLLLDYWNPDSHFHKYASGRFKDMKIDYNSLFRLWYRVVNINRQINTRRRTKFARSVGRVCVSGGMGKPQ